MYIRCGGRAYKGSLSPGEHRFSWITHIFHFGAAIVPPFLVARNPPFLSFVGWWLRFALLPGCPVFPNTGFQRFLRLSRDFFEGKPNVFIYCTGGHCATFLGGV